jgi:hypothetical protein
MSVSIAHEVNQPLAAVVNNANACLNLLRRATPDPDEVRNALAEIVEVPCSGRIRQLAQRTSCERESAGFADCYCGCVAAGPRRVFCPPGDDSHGTVRGTAARLWRSGATPTGVAQPRGEWNGSDGYRRGLEADGDRAMRTYSTPTLILRQVRIIGRSSGESLAIVPRRYFQIALEGDSHSLFIAKAA